MKHSNIDDTSNRKLVTHPLDPDDAAPLAALRAMVLPYKGMFNGVAAREPFNAVMERVSPRSDVSFKAGTVGGVPGVSVHPTSPRSDEAILHLHGGWFNFGAALALSTSRRTDRCKGGLAGIHSRLSARPEHPFPAAVDDVLACYRGLGGRPGFKGSPSSVTRLEAISPLAWPPRVTGESGAIEPATLVGVVALSPVTDLTLSGASYQTRADADPLFTRPQVEALVQAYLRDADPKDPAAWPLLSRLTGLPHPHPCR